MHAIDLVRGPKSHRSASDAMEALRAAEDIVTGILETRNTGFVANEKLRHVRDRLCDKMALLIAPPIVEKHCSCCLFGIANE